MIRRHVFGLFAALVTPMWIASNRWRQLLVTPPNAAVPAIPAVDVASAIRYLRGLSRIPGMPWRATCLYRSVTACLLLRWTGTPAVLKLGAMTQPMVSAHAWVETPGGAALYERSDGWAALQSARTLSS